MGSVGSGAACVWFVGFVLWGVGWDVGVVWDVRHGDEVVVVVVFVVVVVVVVGEGDV